MMISEKRNIKNHRAIKVTQFFMHLFGMWHVKSGCDNVIAYIKLILSTIFIMSVVSTQLMIFYYHMNNLNALFILMPSIFVSVSESSKFVAFVIQRKKIMDIIVYTENTFWNDDYNSDDLAELEQCKRFIMTVYPIYLILVGFLSCQYIMTPFAKYIASGGKIRELPFVLYFGVDWTLTPIYQIAYILEILATGMVGACSMSSAGFLFTMNTYTAAQFKILQKHLHALCDIKNSRKNHSDIAEIHIELNNCIKQHQILINYVAKIESLYAVIILFQVLNTIVILCFSGFALIDQASTDIQRTILSSQYLIACTIQLLFYAFSCHKIMDESRALGFATYSAAWYNVAYSRHGRSICQSLNLMLIRAERPCVLTVGKFAPMSLITYAAVLKTAMSYFTVIRSINEG